MKCVYFVQFQQATEITNENNNEMEKEKNKIDRRENMRSSNATLCIMSER